MTIHPEGYASLDSRVSAIEQTLYEQFHATLGPRGFHYLSIPTFIHRRTIERQGVVAWDHILKVSEDLGLAGSAEQGLLEHFADQEVSEGRWWAHNQCFRGEDAVDGMFRLREFRKTELFSFTTGNAWMGEWETLLRTSTDFLDTLGLQWRVVDVGGDPGYHQVKADIEVFTRSRGWIETHSCTYFGEEQTRRFGITGATHTISNTGIATPRLLIPLLEKLSEN